MPNRPANAAPPHQVDFDRTSEVFATDARGNFRLPLLAGGKARIETAKWDEYRFACSVWHPSAEKAIDLDRAYIELHASFDPKGEHWMRVSEVEPVVPPYSSDGRFDGWVLLPVLAESTALALCGAGLEPRTRVQVRCHAYFVS